MGCYCPDSGTMVHFLALCGSLGLACSLITIWYEVEPGAIHWVGWVACAGEDQSQSWKVQQPPTLEDLTSQELEGHEVGAARDQRVTGSMKCIMICKACGMGRCGCIALVRQGEVIHIYQTGVLLPHWTREQMER